MLTRAERCSRKCRLRTYSTLDLIRLRCICYFSAMACQTSHALAGPENRQCREWPNHVLHDGSDTGSMGICVLHRYNWSECDFRSVPSVLAAIAVAEVRNRRCLFGRDYRSQRRWPCHLIDREARRYGVDRISSSGRRCCSPVISILTDFIASTSQFLA